MCPGFPDEVYQHTLVFSLLVVRADGGKMLSNIYFFFYLCKEKNFKLFTIYTLICPNLYKGGHFYNSAALSV